MLTASRERNALIDHVEAGGSKRRLREIAHVGLDRDDLARGQRRGTGDEIGYVELESVPRFLRIGLEIDEEHAAV
ncbi:MAG TPA: hypothetical protein VK538_02700, partial [Solirubrobacteraceae bacterium]|nr:hypothetical protein [Solirubrobacteraceae bacterium]